MSYTWDQVVAWLGLVIPLAALAWAAILHVRTERREQQYREYQKFFEIMRELGSKESTVPGNMAAVFELRKFPEYKDVIVRLCEDAPLEGTATKLLAREMSMTAEYLKART
jgi:hypothetical protein